MMMKIKSWLVIMLLFVLAGCSNSDDTLESQESTITNFLIQNKLDFIDLKGVYRHIRHNSQNGEVVAQEDSIAIYYSGHRFSASGNLGLGSYFYGNIKSDAEANKFETSKMDFSPMRIKVGAGNLAGLDMALPGTHRGDTIIIYMTSDYAYGERGCYTVPKSASIAMKVVVDSVWRE
jgi:hypothetical protein